MTDLFVSLLTVINRVNFNERLDIDASSILFVGGDDGEIADDNDDDGSDQEMAG
jgi:predicted methyltransferase